MRKWLAPTAFVVAIGAGVLATSGPIVTSPEAACPAGTHASFSKYTGTTCQADANSATKGIASVVGGCLVGVFGGTPVSVFAGCGAGAVGAVTGGL